MVITIQLSAKDSSEDIVEGFDSGGDDYIRKPFNLNELKARVKAMIRRTQRVEDVIKYKDIVYSASNKTFSIDSKELKLTHLEHDLFLEFLKNKNMLLTHEVLLERVWKDKYLFKKNPKIRTVFAY